MTLCSSVDKNLSYYPIIYKPFTQVKKIFQVLKLINTYINIPLMNMLVSYMSAEFTELCSESRKLWQRNHSKWELTTTS